jgi:hypothetical protein
MRYAVFRNRTGDDAVDRAVLEGLRRLRVNRTDADSATLWATIEILWPPGAAAREPAETGEDPGERPDAADDGASADAHGAPPVDAGVLTPDGPGGGATAPEGDAS